MNKSDLVKSETATAQHLGGEYLWQDNIPICMVLASTKNNVFLRVNRATCRFLGYSKKELLGMTVRDVTHPDDWATTAKKIRQLQSDGRPYSRFEKRYLQKKGKVVWGEVNSSLIDDGSPKPKYRLTQVVDITKRKEAEEALRLANEQLRLVNERFRIALAGSPTTVFTQDRDLRYTWAYNPVSSVKLEDFLGKTDRDIFNPDEAKKLMRIKREVMKTGVGHHAEVVLHSFGDEKVFDAKYEPLRDNRGKIIGIICASIDITEHKRMEEALRQANEQLEEKVKDRTIRLRNLTGVVLQIEHRERRRISHVLHEDVQQQLAALKFLANGLKAEYPTPSVVTSADRMLNELDHAIEVCRTLSVDLRPHVLNHMSMGKCIEWLASDVRNRMGLEVKVKVNETSDLASDEVRIFAFEAVRELLLNAVKHSKVKSAEVLFSSMGANRVKLQVRDKGVGYDPKQNHEANRHFGHFSIQERAELLGGHFEVISQPGKGTCATLILPCGESG